MGAALEKQLALPMFGVSERSCCYRTSQTPVGALVEEQLALPMLGISERSCRYRHRQMPVAKAVEEQLALPAWHQSTTLLLINVVRCRWERLWKK